MPIDHTHTISGGPTVEPGSAVITYVPSEGFTGVINIGGPGVEPMVNVIGFVLAHATDTQLLDALYGPRIPGSDSR